MINDFMWTPPGASASEIEAHLALTEGFPQYLMPSIYEWHIFASRGSSSYSKVPLSDVLKFQAAARIHIGVTPDADLHYYQLHRAMESWSQELIAAFVDFFLSQIARPVNASNSLDGAAADLEKRLAQGGSTWAVGLINGRYRLVDRVPAGVLLAMDGIMSAAGKASHLLRQSWERAYGIDKNPSHAYFDAVRAVEVLSCPLFSPADKEPTLGKDINVLRTGMKKFSFTMADSDRTGASLEKVLGMMQLLWHSQTDRHGKDDYQGVSVQEAQAAVLLAATLIGWLSQGAVGRL
jgi:hypothetical protein